jgi:hypothetical protein
MTFSSLYIESLTILEETFQHGCYDYMYTDSDDISRWSNEWIQKCSKDHEFCKNEFVAMEMKDALPIRLLDVQDAKSGTVRLVSTESLERDIHIDYCALSHCWGGTVDVMLTRIDLENMLKGIAVRSLPKSFQDAITVTHQLGIQYLWIDSLCIVQDDTSEWKIESTKMGLVYANARCTISATASRDSTGGCFRPRDLSYIDCGLRESEKDVLLVHPGQTGPEFNKMIVQW